MRAVGICPSAVVAVAVVAGESLADAVLLAVVATLALADLVLLGIMVAALGGVRVSEKPPE